MENVGNEMDARLQPRINSLLDSVSSQDAAVQRINAAIQTLDEKVHKFPAAAQDTARHGSATSRRQQQQHQQQQHHQQHTKETENADFAPLGGTVRGELLGVLTGPNVQLGLADVLQGIEVQTDDREGDGTRLAADATSLRTSSLQNIAFTVQAIGIRETSIGFAA